MIKATENAVSAFFFANIPLQNPCLTLHKRICSQWLVLKLALPLKHDKKKMNSAIFL